MTAALAITPKIGATRVEDAREYGHKTGFVIEMFEYWNQSEPRWGVPAWDEWGFGDLDRVFATRSEAEKALASA